RVWLGWFRPADGGEESLPDSTGVGGEVGVAQGAPLADAENDVHGTRFDLLDGGDCSRVEAELEDVGGLLRPGQLGVEGFVAPVPQRGRLVDAFEEVGTASPVALHECRLVDDLGAGAHGFFGRSSGGGEIPTVVANDIDYLAALGMQVGQVGGFVLLALAAQ